MRERGREGERGREREREGERERGNHIMDQIIFSENCFFLTVL